MHLTNLANILSYSFFCIDYSTDFVKSTAIFLFFCLRFHFLFFFYFLFSFALLTLSLFFFLLLFWIVFYFVFSFNIIRSWLLSIVKNLSNIYTNASLNVRMWYQLLSNEFSNQQKGLLYCCSVCIIY